MYTVLESKLLTRMLSVGPTTKTASNFGSWMLSVHVFRSVQLPVSRATSFFANSQRLWQANRMERNQFHTKARS